MGCSRSGAARWRRRIGSRPRLAVRPWCRCGRSWLPLERLADAAGPKLFDELPLPIKDGHRHIDLVLAPILVERRAPAGHPEVDAIVRVDVESGPRSRGGRLPSYRRPRPRCRRGPASRTASRCHPSPASGKGAAGCLGPRSAGCLASSGRRSRSRPQAGRRPSPAARRCVGEAWSMLQSLGGSGAESIPMAAPAFDQGNPGYIAPANCSHRTVVTGANSGATCR